jgi:hypothetical protein
MVDRSHEAWRTRWLPELDPGIGPYVDVLRAAGIETFESCEGGDGHAYAEPTVRFAGGREELPCPRRSLGASLPGPVDPPLLGRRRRRAVWTRLGDHLLARR